MIRSRRAIPSKKLPTLLIIIFLLLSALIFFGWMWLRAQKNIGEKGQILIGHKLTEALGSSISITSASLTFPNHLLIRDITVLDQNRSRTILRLPRLEIDLSIISMVTGTIRPKKVRIIAPQFDFATTGEELPIWQQVPIFLPKTSGKGSIKKIRLRDRIRPSYWPVEINPNHIEIVEGRAHIEDEDDTMPSIDGSFSLTAERNPDRKNIALVSADIHLNAVNFFYHGIQGSMTGNIMVKGPDASSLLTLNLGRDGELEIRTKVNDYQKKQKVTFEIDARSFDLKNLAMIKYPLVRPPADASITGLFTSSSPLLYGTPCESFSASILYNQGSWRIDAISLKLTEAKGEITGAIVPDSANNSKTAKANLFFSGKVKPEFQFRDNLLNTLAPILQNDQYTAGMEMNIDSSSYPLQATEIKMTSSQGDLFAKGVLDLFSGYVRLEGTYLIPAGTDKTARDDQAKGPHSFSLSIAGPVNAPELSVPPGTNE